MEGLRKIQELSREGSYKKIKWIIFGFFLVIILFLSFFVGYLNAPEKKIGLGAEIEDIFVEKGTAFIRLVGGSNFEEIDKIRFVFSGEDGKEYVYETVEGLKEIEVPYEKSFLDWILGRNHYEGVYNYQIEAEEVGLENFEGIDEVEVIFKYKEKKEETSSEPPVGETKERAVAKKSFNTGSGGGGSGGNGFEVKPCTEKSCTELGFECGDAINNCNGNINCGNCSNGLSCINHKCINESCSVTNTPYSFSCYNESVYWLDNCGGVGDLKEGCGDGCEEGACVEFSCTLTNATWSVDFANESDRVNLIVQGEHCDGGEVSFIIYESDNGGDDNVRVLPAKVAFENGIATGTWVAEYQPDGSFGINDPPEYYFIASVVDNTDEKADSREQESYLSVNKLRGEPICGDGVINGNEICDGSSFGGETCESQGYDSGSLDCSADCMSFDLTECSNVAAPVCGDGLVESAEECDDDNILNSDGCSSACKTESGWTCSGSPSSCNQENLICTTTVRIASELNTAKANAKPGNLVCLEEGNYGDVVFSSSSAKGTPGRWITYKSTKPSGAKFKSISFDGVYNAYIQIEGFEVYNPSQTEYILRINGPDYVNIINCEVHGPANKPGPQYALVSLRQESSNVLIDGCEIYDSGNRDAEGVNFWGGHHNITIRNSHIYDIVGSGIRTDEASDLIIIENNIIHDQREDWSPSVHGSGISIHSSNMVVRNNTIYNFGNTRPIRTYQGVFRGGGYKNILIENNLVYRTSDFTRTQWWSEFIDAGDNFTMRNNVFESVEINIAENKDGSGLSLKNNLVAGSLDIAHGYSEYGNEHSASDIWSKIKESGNIYDSLKNFGSTASFAGSVKYSSPRSLLDAKFYPKTDDKLCNGYFSWAQAGVAAAGALPCRGTQPQQCLGTVSSCGIYPDCRACSDGCYSGKYLDYSCSSQNCVSTEVIVQESPENGNCNDGKDNDCDGNSDGTDSGCAAAPVVLDDYVSYWKFDADARDEAGVNSGSLKNGAAIVTDSLRGGALNLDGVNDYVLVNHHESINFANSDFSISVWFKTSTQRVHNYMFSKDYSSGKWYGVNLNTEDKKINLYVDGGGDLLTNLQTSDDYNDGNWHHLVFIRNRASNKLISYVDGELNSEIEDISGDISNTGNLIIGTRADLADRWFQGRIDDMIIYDRALSDQEIKEISGGAEI